MLMLRYVTLRYVTLRYVTLRYVMLCYVSEQEKCLTPNIQGMLLRENLSLLPYNKGITILKTEISIEFVLPLIPFYPFAKVSVHICTLCFREYIMDLLEGGHKLIVFAHHLNMLDVISEALVKKVHMHILSIF